MEDLWIDYPRSIYALNASNVNPLLKVKCYQGQVTSGDTFNYSDVKEFQMLGVEKHQIRMRTWLRFWLPFTLSKTWKLKSLDSKFTVNLNLGQSYFGANEFFVM